MKHAHSSTWNCRCEASTRSVATCGANHTNSWQWAPQARQCGAARISSAQAQFLLQHKWIVMAGDSITRFMFAALLRLLAQDGMLLFKFLFVNGRHQRICKSESICRAFEAVCLCCHVRLHTGLRASLTALLGCTADEQKIVFGHQDFQYTLPGNVRASFIWAPYTVNVTSHIQKWYAKCPLPLLNSC